MGIEYQVVRCFKCLVFQVTQRRVAVQKKKRQTFECKLCGETQSFKKIYANSYKAADLRPLVRDYNYKFGRDKDSLSNCESVVEEDPGWERLDTVSQKTHYEFFQPTEDSPKTSKWSGFMEGQVFTFSSPFYQGNQQPV